MPWYQKSVLVAIVSLIIGSMLTTVTHAQVVSKANQQRKFINPTGTYILKGKQKGNETYGYFGHVYVKYIAPKKITVKFFICKGYMSYSSGNFYDTLVYHNNIAVYGPTEYDSTCKITLTFHHSHLVVNEKTANYNNGCGFGHAVVANAVFRKRSSSKPNQKEMNAD